MALATMSCGCEVSLPEPSGPKGRLAAAACSRHTRRDTFYTVAVAIPSPTQPAVVHAAVARDEPVPVAEQAWTHRYEWRLRK